MPVAVKSNGAIAVSGGASVWIVPTVGGGDFSGPHIGGNIVDSGGAIGSDSNDCPWADLVSHSRGFGQSGNFYENWAILDSSGWPTSACELVLAASDNQTNPIIGTYAGSYDDSGSSTLSLVNNSNCSIANVSRVGTHVTFDFVVSAAPFQAVFRWDGGVTNVKVITPGYTSSDVLITTAIDYYKQFAILRPMDFMNTNGNTTEVDWSDRVPAEKRWGKKSWEALFDFITPIYNASGSNLKAVWLCVPAAATAAYCTSLATLAASRLPAGIIIYFEVSNELWNYGAAFTQSGWMDAWANNASNPDYARVRGVGEPSTTPGYYDAKANFWGLTFARMAQAVIAVLGTRARPALIGQLGNIGWTQLSRDFLTESGQVSEFGAFNTYCYAIGGAPYLQCFAYENSVGTAALLNEAFQNNITDNMVPLFDSWKTYADSIGVTEVIAYEAGTDMTDDNNITVKQAAWADSTSSPDNGTTVAYNLVKAMWDAGWTNVCWYNVTPNHIATSGTVWYTMWTTNQSFTDTPARGAGIDQLVALHP